MKSILAVLLSTLLSLYSVDGIRIGAFNVKVFGETKVSNPEVMNILAQIAQRYDILSIEELHENPKYTRLPLETLANLTNSKYGTKFHTIKSRPLGLGNTDFKENYGFLYRESISAIDSAVFENGSGKLFLRDPFLVQFQAIGMKFVLASVHTKPKIHITPNEISHLSKVFDEAERRFQTEDIIVLGDLNAGTNYVKNWTNIPIKHDSSVHWLINDDVDTTVSGLGQAYDRILLKGKHLFARFVRGSNGTFDFPEKFNLNRTTAAGVSDHKPVEIQLT